MTCARGGTTIPASLLNGHQIGHVVHHAAQIIDPVGIGDVGMPGLPLSHLFRAAVMETDLRHRIHDFLAVKLQDDAQHSMGSGMLRSDVEEEEILAVAAGPHAPVLGPEAHRLLFGFLLFVGQLERTHFRSSRGMILAKRMSHPGLRHKQAFQVWMSLKADPEHVPDFPFVPVRRWPKIGTRINRRLVPLERHFNADVLVPVKRQQVVHQREVACRWPLGMIPHALVDGGEVVEHPVRLIDFLFQITSAP